MSRLQLFVMLSLLLAKAFKIIFANSEWDLTCAANDIVADQLTKQAQLDCTKELNVTPENSSCVVQCMFQKNNMTEADGKPSKELFDKFCDEHVDPKIRDKIKNNMTCFTEHAANVVNNDTMCQGSVDFDQCFETFMSKVCQ